MTSLIAWIGVDARGAASAYFASDSRITWPRGGMWDHGRKLFACRRYPHILGYCGDVLFPTQTLSPISEMVDADLLAAASESGDMCLARVVSVLSTALETYPAAAKQAFDVLYCIREGEGVPSRFHLWQLTFAPSARPRVSLISMPESSTEVNTIVVNDVRWYNSRFEICDPYTLARKPDAQPQPRPKELRR